MNVSEMVFPAYAGMSPGAIAGRGGAVSFPRLRGDEPHLNISVNSNGEFSPPTRG